MTKNLLALSKPTSELILNILSKFLSSNYSLLSLTLNKYASSKK